MSSTYHIGKSADIFLRVNNVFDKHYATAGFLADNTFNPNGSFRFTPDDWTHENATSPAQPRAAWAAVRFRF
jgi:iron complex outermembrane receptor protein